jgi:hypothetical protein
VGCFKLLPARRKLGGGARKHERPAGKDAASGGKAAAMSSSAASSPVTSTLAMFSPAMGGAHLVCDSLAFMMQRWRHFQEQGIFL